MAVKVPQSGRQTQLEGFEKLESKVNYHKMYYAVVNALEKDIRDLHYTNDDGIEVTTVTGDSIKF